MIAFITSMAGAFDAALAETLAAGGFDVYARDAGLGAVMPACVKPVVFDPDCSDSIDAACAALTETPGHIDLYIETSDYRSGKDCFTVGDGIDYAVMNEVYTANVLRPIALYEGFLPLMNKGEMKRYCFITSAKASVNLSTDVSGYGYNMAKAGLYNFLQIAKNRRMPEGFTFRVFDPCAGELEAEAAAKSAYYYFTRRRAIENRDDEPHLVIRDAFGRQQSW